MKRFNDFIKEDKTENKISYEDFLEDVKSAVMRDFSRSADQADAFINQYEKILVEYWENGFTTREAVAACKIPGVKISPDSVDESFIFQIDENYEEIYNKIDNLKINNLNKAEVIINEYFDKYSRKNYSDKRIFDRVKNNYKSLIELYESKLEGVEKDMDMKIYDINTWKYLMFEPSKELGIIKGIESIRTGSALTKKEYADEETKSNEIYIKYGYKVPERHSHKPDWYKHMDIRFDVKVKTKTGTASWHIRKVLPLTEERFFELGGEKY